MSTQLINSSDNCVDELLEGFVEGNSGLVLLKRQRVIVDKRRIVGRRKGVAVVIGGGSGHEPFGAGYVGKGLVDAAVAGHVFTSPPTDSIVAAIMAVGRDNPDGVLVIVFNYTGDRVNFGLAVERCRAAGLKVEMFISGDDSAMTRVKGTAGRRGLCGTMFILKIVCAMIAQGAPLEDALGACHKLGSVIGTIGFAASGCQLPGANTPLFTVAEGMLELGLGVHGETGAATIKAGTASEMVETLLQHLTRKDSETRLDVKEGDDVAVILNNLGCTSQLEMGVLRREVVLQLRKRGLNPIRIFQGPLMTSLDMKGVHLSLLRVLDPLWVSLLDAPTNAPAWPRACLWEGDVEGEGCAKRLEESLLLKAEEVADTTYILASSFAASFRSCLESVLQKLPPEEESLNALDAGCGDGDCGTTLLLGLVATSKKLPSLRFTDPASVLASLGDVASTHMGGSSGGLYSILLTAASSSLASSGPEGVSHRRRWAEALRKGVEAVSKYGGAGEGDRTMLDALFPALRALESAEDSQNLRSLLAAMAASADDGAKKTAAMRARAGRASYVRAENVKGEDAGARAVASILHALATY